jgi:hypothetical protein
MCSVYVYNWQWLVWQQRNHQASVHDNVDYRKIEGSNSED